MGLAGEALVTKRFLDYFAAAILRQKRLQRQLGHVLEGLKEVLPQVSLDERTAGQLTELRIVPLTVSSRWWTGWRILSSFARRFAGFSGLLCITKYWTAVCGRSPMAFKDFSEWCGMWHALSARPSDWRSTANSLRRSRYPGRG